MKFILNKIGNLSIIYIFLISTNLYQTNFDPKKITLISLTAHVFVIEYRKQTFNFLIKIRV
jgi:hypothetical protein